ncbi:hypothetical protein [Microtetraspora malaysiensis]|uniref:hypothetical protein n=1 Tax=Microtetraspora malaysiensis TaxID=161358 RepID=UPI0012F94748|nr:hypothetical protein [Microtetraspora malaysiensis]
MVAEVEISPREAEVLDLVGAHLSNPVADAIVERAEALLDGDQEALLATADALAALGLAPMTFAPTPMMTAERS